MSSPGVDQVDGDLDDESVPTRPFKSTLFLPEDSDDEAIRSPHRPALATLSQDVLDLFDDLDNDVNIRDPSEAPPSREDMDDAFTLKPLGPSLDVASLEKEARARQAQSKPRLPPSQPNAFDTLATQEAQKDGEENGTEKGKDERKPGLRIPRLDEGRLLGKDGFPALMKHVKDFKLKGKGHEAQDLDRLFLTYQFWAHQLYPKTQFRDTIERVEKLCHSRRMNVALSVYRDEAHGKTRLEEEVMDLTDAEGDAEDKADEPPASEPITPSSSRPPSEPPSSSRSHANDFDDDEFEAAIQAETQRQASGLPEVPSKVKANFGSVQDDDMMDVDREDWDKLIAGAFEDSNDIPQTDSKAVANGNEGVADDDDIWDIVDEVQNEQTAGKTVLPQRRDISEAEENWEDMYI